LANRLCAATTHGGGGGSLYQQHLVGGRLQRQHEQHLEGGSLTQLRWFSSSCPLWRRMGKRERTTPEWKRAKFEKGPWWKKPDIIMTAPLSKTLHPENQFKQMENKFVADVYAAGQDDLPLQMEDPYKQEAKMCTLCPRRYAEPIRPDYKNPKLLSQFVSPHTGRVYQAHITGLCNYMQTIVEREVYRSQCAGFLSTRVRDPLYLQDPSLFNPNRPVKRNPY